MIKSLIENQKYHFASKRTKDVNYRKKYLKKFHSALIAREDEICDAIYKDFKKPKFESLVTETQIVLSELKYIINHLDIWAKPERTSGPLANFPSTNWLYHEPYGTVLIISPWNYPFMLSISPLIGALAAGNTVVLKPSELSPITSKALFELVEEVFPKEYVTVVEGGVEVAQELLAERWDYIFFTGSSHIGKIIYKSAAENLTPVTLELGGKNPCVIDETAAINLAATRITWGKFMNAGQTCVAPDYILIHKSVKDKFVQAIKDQIEKFYGKDIEHSPDFARITTKKHYQALKGMISGQNILYGGNHNDETQYLEPTLIDEPSLDSSLMQGEIFGPILPIISYDSEEEIAQIILHYEKPLSLYVFSKRKKFQQKIINSFGFGGGCINDVVMHIANKNLPFGGVGDSGIGGYHGIHSFKLFSHKKAIVKKPNWGDIPIKYPPYKLPDRLTKLFRHIL